jgi:hypothetical protein
MKTAVKKKLHSRVEISNDRLFKHMDSHTILVGYAVYSCHLGRNRCKNLSSADSVRRATVPSSWEHIFPKQGVIRTS